MTNPTEVIPGVIFYAFLSTLRKEKVCFFEHSTLVLQVSGHFTLETANQKISMSAGEMLLIRKNQVGELTKMPLNSESYETIIICLKEDLLRQYALEKQIEPAQRYTGQPNILIPKNDFCKAFFNPLYLTCAIRMSR